MTFAIWEFWLGVVIALLFVIAGVIGSIIPVIPGTPFIFVGALVYGFVSHFEQINLTVLISLGVIAVVSTILGYLASSFGAKKYGATRWGLAGATIGTIVGVLVLGPIGLAIFPFVFAFLFELLGAMTTAKKSFKIALGALVGVLGNTLMQFVFALVMIVTIVVALF